MSVKKSATDVLNEGLRGDWVKALPESLAEREVHHHHHGDQTPPITIADARIDDLVDRVAELDSRVKDVASAVENQAAQNRDLWIKLRQGLLLAAKFIEKVHIRMERY